MYCYTNKRKYILAIVSIAHYHTDKYKLTGDPENPTSPGFPFLPGSPFMEKTKKKAKGLKCSLLRVNDKPTADQKSLEGCVQCCEQYKNTELYFLWQPILASQFVMLSLIYQEEMSINNTGLT